MVWFMIGAIASILSGAVSAYSSYQQGKQTREVQKQNARQVELDRIAEEQETREAMRRQRVQNKREQGMLRARIAKSGLDAEGTPLAVFSMNAARQELELQDVRRADEAASYRAQYKAKSLIYSGDQAYKAGVIGGAGSLLQGIAGATSYMGRK